MKWNYRIGISKTANPWFGMEGPEGEHSHTETYNIVKCFYLDDNFEEPLNFTKVSLTEGMNVKELKWSVEQMQDAFALPVLNLDELC